VSVILIRSVILCVKELILVEVTGPKLTLILSVGLIIFLIVVNAAGITEPPQNEEAANEASEKEVKVELNENEKLAVRVIARPNGKNQWSLVLQKIKLPKEVYVRGGREKKSKAGLEWDEKCGIEIVSENYMFPFLGHEDEDYYQRKQSARLTAEMYTNRFNGRW